MSSLQTLKSLINERLCAAAEDIFVLVERIITDYEEKALFHSKQHIEQPSRILDVVSKPHLKLHRADVLQLPDCEQQKRSPSRVQNESEPPQIQPNSDVHCPQNKDEQKELLQRPEEADASTLTLLVVKNEDYDENRATVALTSTDMKPQTDIKDNGVSQPTSDLQRPQIKDEQEEETDGPRLTLVAVKSDIDDKIGETETVASASTEHMNSQTDVEDFWTSQQTSEDQLLSSQYCSESDTDDCFDWEETREAQLDLNALKTHNVEGQRLSLSINMSQDLESSKQPPSKRCRGANTTFCSTDCGKEFCRHEHLKRHRRTHKLMQTLQQRPSSATSQLFSPSGNNPSQYAIQSSTSTAASATAQPAPRVWERVRHSSTMPRVFPDIPLQTVPVEVERIVHGMSRNKDLSPRPVEYAVRMFLFLVDFETYRGWAGNVSWKGSSDKQALPKNLTTELKRSLAHRFGPLKSVEWKAIRDRINDRLRNPRKTDPRLDGDFCSYY